MDPGNVLYLLRAAAHSVDYMNSGSIQADFKRVARQVEQRWVDFFALYNTVQGTNYDVSTAYQKWLKARGILANYGPNAQSFFTDAVNVLSAQLAAAAAQGLPVMVGVPKQCSSTKVPFTQNDLTNLQNSLPAGITWTYP
ncbi:uncharacterized protein TRAVEDRAFT_49125 [Trametes versicolor FP-101664 SS1]|uniref:uncharacterized protein n=1 Tax=Trametes versicolor (strain FP-101664) TaxID=717944 RepID=UPI000462496B|nr:uncharacterized protein TRAVEDRAFT_49125 [Trametes versicolor FP-101664 SS1]EIW56289.1 hypothetical protein TRAVEDRAFT_49125 [Trametes versicolor FP-101664 SS1]